MTERDFVYWLRGYLEVAKPEKLEVKELEVIKEHLDKVVIYVAPRDHTPFIGGDRLVIPPTLTC